MVNFQNNCNPGQLYSKLFDEVEKIKCWKVKLDSDTVQKERQLQENKRTIETQRKAIQELQVCTWVTAFLCMSFSVTTYICYLFLIFRVIDNGIKKYCSTMWDVCWHTLCVLSLQFGNESLSIKLEERISENEDLRNKYVFILKDLKINAC